VDRALIIVAAPTSTDNVSPHRQEGRFDLTITEPGS